MASTENKIRFGGWSSPDWKEVRNRMNRFWEKDEAEEEQHPKVRRARTYKCAKNKGNHTWALQSVEKSFFRNKLWYKFLCTACNKQECAFDEEHALKMANGVLPDKI